MFFVNQYRGSYKITVSFICCGIDKKIMDIRLPNYFSDKSKIWIFLFFLLYPSTRTRDDSFTREREYTCILYPMGVWVRNFTNR
jgi:hypothetical protein